MKYTSLIASIALVGTPVLYATPKSYTLVNFTGAVTDVKISFAFKEGWPQGSTISTTVAEKSNSKFNAAHSEDQFQFESYDKKTVITLKMNTEGKAPNKIEGTFSSGGKDLAITLTKSKKK